MVEAFVSWHAEHHVVARVVQYELRSLDDATRVEVNAVRRRLEDVVEAAVREGVADGSMVVDQPRTATRAVLSLAVDVARWFDPRGRETAGRGGQDLRGPRGAHARRRSPADRLPREDHPVTTEERPAGRTPAGPMDVTGLPHELERREPAEILAGLLAVMDLRALEPDAAGQDMFEGDSQWQPHGRVYGGQVLGQTLMAASLHRRRRTSGALDARVLPASGRRRPSRSSSRSSGCATAARSPRDGCTRCRTDGRSCR